MVRSAWMRVSGLPRFAEEERSILRVDVQTCERAGVRIVAPL